MPSFKSSSNRRMLRTWEAAEYTGIARSTLEKLRVRGSGCPFIRIGRVIVYSTDELDSWLAAHRRTSTSDRPCETRKHGSRG
jgi:excisionase family DNA binding protein